MWQDTIRGCSSPDTTLCTAMTRRGARSKAIWAGSVSILGISSPVTPSCGVASRRITMETTNTKACRRRCVGFSNRLVPLTHARHARSGHTENSVSRLPFFVSLLCPFETKHHSRFLHNLHPRRLANCLHLTRRSSNWPLTITNYVTGWQIWGSVKNFGKL